MSTRAATHSTSGRSAAPVVTDPLEQVRGVEVLEAVGLPDRHRLVAQQVDARVVRGVAPRRGLQLLAADLEAGLAQILDDPGQLLAGVLGVDGRADAGQVGAACVVVPGADPDARCGDLDVPAGGRADRDERPLGGLVRRLVLREPHVTVGAEHLRGAELLGQRRGQGEHRLAHGSLVDVLVRLPERLGVVELEVVVEVERSVRETGESRLGSITVGLCTGLVHGADDEIRTRDIDLGKVALYQLSYIRASGPHAAGRRGEVTRPARVVRSGPARVAWERCCRPTSGR